jgi:hypothetical protein
MPQVSAGHLSLDIDNAQQQNAGFRFDREPARLSVSLITSIAIDALGLMLLVFASRAHRAADDRPVEFPPHSIVWRRK